MPGDDRDVVEALVRRELSWPELLRLMREPKETTRFLEVIAAYQRMVSWPEPILLPLGEHLFIVAKQGRAVVKTTCGEELGLWPGNWKMRCRIYVRDSRERLEAFYPPEHLTIDPNLVELREFICPRCGTLLDVDCVPPTYPVELEFEPDLEGFYKEWLRQDLPVKLALPEE